MSWRHCDPLQSHRRRSTPIKKPAATNAAGFDHGRFLFPRGMRCRRPPFDAAGGGACDAAGDRVLFSHSLLQGTSAWAKPNHGFSDCQQPVAKKISGARASSTTCCFAIAHPRCAMRARRCAHACWQMQKRREKRDFSDSSHSRMHAFAPHHALPFAPPGVHGHARIVVRFCGRAASPLRVAQARLRKTARTFFADRAPMTRRSHGFRGFENKEPAVFAAGSDDAFERGRRYQWSSSSSSSA